MNDKTYNGWTNYETWVINLWMSNEEGSYRYWHDVTADVMREHDEDDHEIAHGNALRALADQLKTYHEEAMPEVQGVWSDLLTAALGEVNWYEIARTMVADYESGN
jgi:hypothetical protein